VLHEVRTKRRIKRHSRTAAILFCFSDFSHKEQVALASNYFESFGKKKKYAYVLASRDFMIFSLGMWQITPNLWVATPQKAFIN
jgi:hypothetical protein